MIITSKLRNTKPISSKTPNGALGFTQSPIKAELYNTKCMQKYYLNLLSEKILKNYNLYEHLNSHVM